MSVPSPQAEFLLGKSYYSDDSFGLAAEHFEVAVSDFFVADKECRALCEGAYDYDGYNYMEYSADLFQTMTGETPHLRLFVQKRCVRALVTDCDCVSDHYMQVLNCKQHCSVELASTAGRDKPFEDFLPSHFNYLQFSYYNSESRVAVFTELLFLVCLTCALKCSTEAALIENMLVICLKATKYVDIYNH